MVIAFLDLLGFSDLLEINEEMALNNLNAFNSVLHTRIIDELSHPLSEYQCEYPENEELHKYVEKTSVTSFENMISLSDSLVIGANNIDLFIKQLMNFVATVYINSTEQMRNLGAKSLVIDYPLLFRGGISFGENVHFFDEYHIKDSNVKKTSINVFGQTYLKAVKLEKAGKGPRLFCDRSIVEVVSNKNILKEVSGEAGVYEIVWTIEGCEAVGQFGDSWHNVMEAINNKMLPAAARLYEYYNSESKVKQHYKELIELVCCGIVKYANDKCNRAEDALNYINEYLAKNKIDMKFDKSVINGFLDGDIH